MTLIRISPDGKETLHLYDEKVTDMTSQLADVKIHRASDVYFCNKDDHWKIKFKGLVLPVMFYKRQQALDYEKGFLEEYLKEGKKWSEVRGRNKKGK